MSRREIQRQLPTKTRQWIEQRLLGLERAERFERCLRPAHGDGGSGCSRSQRSFPCFNLPVARLLRDRCLHVQPPLPERDDHLSEWNGVLIDLEAMIIQCLFCLPFGFGFVGASWTVIVKRLEEKPEDGSVVWSWVEQDVTRFL